jgi:hypothetical protein
MNDRSDMFLFLDAVLMVVLFPMTKATRRNASIYQPNVLGNSFGVG